MKRVIAVSLVAGLLLTGCGKKAEQPKEQASSVPVETSQEVSSEEEPAQEEAKGVEPVELSEGQEEGIFTYAGSYASIAEHIAVDMYDVFHKRYTFLLPDEATAEVLMKAKDENGLYADIVYTGYKMDDETLRKDAEDYAVMALGMLAQADEKYSSDDILPYDVTVEEINGLIGEMQDILASDEAMTDEELLKRLYDGEYGSAFETVVGMYLDKLRGMSYYDGSYELVSYEIVVLDTMEGFGRATEGSDEINAKVDEHIEKVLAEKVKEYSFTKLTYRDTIDVDKLKPGYIYVMKVPREKQGQYVLSGTKKVCDISGGVTEEFYKNPTAENFMKMEGDGFFELDPMDVLKKFDDESNYKVPTTGYHYNEDPHYIVLIAVK